MMERLVILLLLATCVVAIISPNALALERIDNKPLIIKSNWIKNLNDSYRRIIVKNQSIYMAGGLSVGRFTMEGNAVWERKDHAPNSTTSDTMDIITDGSFLYAIKSETIIGNQTKNSALLYKYDVTGNLIWNITAEIGNRDPNSPQVTSFKRIMTSGNDIYVAGRCINCVMDPVKNYGNVLIKYDQKGQMVWNRTFRVDDTDAIAGLVKLNNDIYIVGSTYNSSQPYFYYVFVCAFDEQGNSIVIEKTLQPYPTVLTDAIVHGNDIYAVGASLSKSVNVLGYLVKFNASGKIAYNITFGLADNNTATFGESIASQDKYIYIGGAVIDDISGKTYPLIAKFTDNGTEVFTDYNWDTTDKIHRIRGIAVVNDIYGLGDSLVKLADIPSSPVNPHVEFGNRTAILTWEKPIDEGTGIFCYQIYRGISNGTMLPISGTQNTSYQDYNLTNGVPYRYYIVAMNIAGEFGEQSQILSGTPFSKPWPPENLTIMVEENSFSLKWSTPYDDGGYKIIQYNIYRGINRTKMDLYRIASMTQYLDTNVSDGIAYYYRVTAVTSIGESNPSITVSAILRGDDSYSIYYSAVIIIALLIIICCIVLLKKDKKKKIKRKRKSK